MSRVPLGATQSAKLGALAIALAIAGCSDAGPPIFAGDVVVPRPPSRLRPTLREPSDQLVAADPQLPGFDGWPLRFEASAHPPGTSCRITLGRGRSTLRTLSGTLDATSCSASWDGRDDARATVRPGEVVATAALVDGAGASLVEATSQLEVVRLGFDRVDATADEGQRVPLLYRRTGGDANGWYEVDAAETPWRMAPDATENGAAALELADGSPRTPPAIWTDLLSPPMDARSSDGVEHDTYSLPTAWTTGAVLRLALHASSDIAGTPAGGDPVATEVRVVAPEGLSVEGDDAFADERSVALVGDGSQVPAVDRYDLALSIQFEARRAGGEWQPIPGAFPVSLRLYGVFAAPTFGSTSIPHRPWVDVLDRMTGWVDGAGTDADTVTSALVRGIYYDLGLRYDTARGASAYTEYTSGFSGAVFYAQAFEERELGRIINCTDAASILSTYGNMMGLDLTYHILRHNRASGFDLNFIQAIGMPMFDDTPFDSGRGGFSYHAIVGSRDGRTWDATLAVDGDGTPTASPFTLSLVQGMDAMAYLVALSSEASSIATTLDEKVRLR